MKIEVTLISTVTSSLIKGQNSFFTVSERFRNGVVFILTKSETTIGLPENSKRPKIKAQAFSFSFSIFQRKK